MSKNSSGTLTKVLRTLQEFGPMTRNELANKLFDTYGTAKSSTYRCLNKGEEFLSKYGIHSGLRDTKHVYMLGADSRPEINSSGPTSGILGLGTEADVRVLKRIREIMDEVCVFKNYGRQDFAKFNLYPDLKWDDTVFTQSENVNTFIKNMAGNTPTPMKQALLLRLALLTEEGKS